MTRKLALSPRPPVKPRVMMDVVDTGEAALVRFRCNGCSFLGQPVPETTLGRGRCRVPCPRCNAK